MGKKLLGSGSKGRQGGNIRGSSGNKITNMLNPSLTGPADVVADRANTTAQGAMEQKQLKKNKSTGLKPGKK